jgi:hypothetical protein
MLFSGRFVVIRDMASVASMATRARDIVEAAFGRRDPERAERDLSPACFDATALRARRAIAADAMLGDLWRATLAGLGYAEDECYSDRLRLRVVPSRAVASAPALASLPPHRDNWASGIAQQINWWMPLYPLASSRTMIVWPQLFRRAVENDSASWDFKAVRSSREGAGALLPTALECPPSPGLPVLIEPGSLLAFSGAQLHASRNDASGSSRLSLDTRTVWIADLKAGRAAPDTDGAARRAHWEWFGNRADPDGARLAAFVEAAKGERS